MENNLNDMELAGVNENLPRRQIVLDKLNEWGIPFTMYEHPPLPTIEIALEYWKDIT